MGDGVIPDIAEAVWSPARLTEDPGRARQILDLVPSVPALVWGRDERRTGDMWNSNLGDLMVARPRRSRSRPDPAPNGWSRARLARRRRDRGSPWCAALTRAVGRITRSTALLSSNEAGGARLLASSLREAARSCGRSFYRDAVAYSGTLTRCSVSVAGALRACRNPRIARIPRSSPAITIATPAHSAIVATVHQP
jgi:hypothetical protein